MNTKHVVFNIYKRMAALAAVFVISISFFAAMPGIQADAGFTNDIDIHCDAVYMINLDTGIIVYEKNADKQKYPASMTKMMTSILAIECYSDLNEKYTIPDKVPGDKKILAEGVWSATGLVAGERVSVKDLLYCALLPSDNVAALALAYKVSEDKGDGTLSWFIQRMNAKAIEIGCTNTQFANPHGLFDERHHSTAKDMAKIAEYCMSNPVFKEIAGCKVSYYRSSTNKHPYGPLSDISDPAKGLSFMRMETTNKLMLSSTAGHPDDGRDPEKKYYYQYVKGTKTGFIKDAGHCYASYAEKDGYRYVLVLMDDRNAFLADGVTVDWTNPEWKKDKATDKGKTKGKTLSELINNRDSTTNYAFVDAKRLYEWAFSDLALKEVFKAGDTVIEVPIKNAWEKDVLALVPAESYRTLLPVNVQAKSIDVKTDMEEVSVSAPVKQGEVICTATLSYGGDVIGTIELVAGETIERSDSLYILKIIGDFFGSPYFYVVLGVMILAAGVYVAYSFMHDQRLSTLTKTRRSVRTTGVWREGVYRDPRYTGPVTTASEHTQNGQAVRSSGYDIFGKARAQANKSQAIRHGLSGDFWGEFFGENSHIGKFWTGFSQTASNAMTLIGKTISRGFYKNNGPRNMRNQRYSGHSGFNDDYDESYDERDDDYIERY